MFKYGYLRQLRQGEAVKKITRAKPFLKTQPNGWVNPAIIFKRLAFHLSYSALYILGPTGL